MTVPRSLPTRPSLESLRKQAKKLARDRSLSLRDAQLTLAREYGFAGWHDLTAEVTTRLGRGLEWAVDEARRLIHDNDVDGLKQLLLEHQALLSWRSSALPRGLLGFATGAYGDSFNSFSEQQFTRFGCAELLLDAGAIVMPSVCDDLLQSRARRLLQLFRRNDLLPRTLKFLAAFDDRDAIRAALDEGNDDLEAVNDAFVHACGFEHETAASLLLERLIALNPELGRRVDQSVGRHAFIKYFVDNRPARATEVGAWKAFVMEQVSRAVCSWSGHRASVTTRTGESDLAEFIRLLRREPWLLGDAFVDFQVRIIERATLNDRAEFITALFDLEPAILRRKTPPPSQAIEFAFTYAKTHLLPVLTRVWPLPDDLPHAAGMGDLPRVKRWFDDSGAPALGNVESHYPCSPYMPKDRVEEYADQWSPHSVQRVLDVAFAWAVMNSHLDVADFLLAHGADINTRWSSHEPASILHELVFHANYPSMQFLIERGIDMTIRDYRWDATAEGWARHAANDEKMAQWLEDAERRRKSD